MSEAFCNEQLRRVGGLEIFSTMRRGGFLFQTRLRAVDLEIDYFTLRLAALICDGLGSDGHRQIWYESFSSYYTWHFAEWIKGSSKPVP